MDAVLGIVEVIADRFGAVGVFKIKAIANVLYGIADKFGVLDVVEKNTVAAVKNMAASSSRDFTVADFELFESIGSDAETRPRKFEVDKPHIHAAVHHSHSAVSFVEITAVVSHGQIFHRRTRTANRDAAALAAGIDHGTVFAPNGKRFRQQQIEFVDPFGEDNDVALLSVLNNILYVVGRRHTPHRSIGGSDVGGKKQRRQESKAIGSHWVLQVYLSSSSSVTSL